MKIEFDIIGTIHSPFKELEGMPIQPTGAKGIKGKICLKDEFKPGLKDIDGFSHLILIYHLHKTNGNALEVKPFMDNKTHGVFATRSPKRPNNIGMTTVKLDKVEDDILYISNVDKMMYCTFPMWTYLTALHFLTSSHTFLSYLKTL